MKQIPDNNTYLYEFEFYEEDEAILAIPFDFEGGTFGEDLQNAAESASDWLREMVVDYLLHDKELPKARYGNITQRGGTLVLIAVTVSLDSLETVSALEAAEMLGVTKSRISQLIKSDLLDAYAIGRSVFVTVESVKARLAEKPKAGRPKTLGKDDPFTQKAEILTLVDSSSSTKNVQAL